MAQAPAGMVGRRILGCSILHSLWRQKEGGSTTSRGSKASSSTLNAYAGQLLMATASHTLASAGWQLLRCSCCQHCGTKLRILQSQSLSEFSVVCRVCRGVNQLPAAMSSASVLVTRYGAACHGPRDGAANSYVPGIGLVDAQHICSV